MNGTTFQDTKARYEMLGQDLYSSLDVNALNSQVDCKMTFDVNKAEASLLMSMLQDGYDPSQLTLGEKRMLVQYFDLRSLDDFIKDDVLQHAEGDSTVPLDSRTKERDLTKVTRHTKGGIQA